MTPTLISSISSFLIPSHLLESHLTSCYEASLTSQVLLSSTLSDNHEARMVLSSLLTRMITWILLARNSLPSPLSTLLSLFLNTVGLLHLRNRFIAATNSQSSHQPWMCHRLLSISLLWSSSFYSYFLLITLQRPMNYIVSPCYLEFLQFLVV
jgi:hypothetical protein